MTDGIFRDSGDQRLGVELRATGGRVLNEQMNLAVADYSEYDALVERLFSTIPLRERTEILGDILQHLTENLPVMALFYNSQPVMIANRLQNAGARRGEDASQTWNAHEWDLR